MKVSIVFRQIKHDGPEIEKIFLSDVAAWNYAQEREKQEDHKSIMFYTETFEVE